MTKNPLTFLCATATLLLPAQTMAEKSWIESIGEGIGKTAGSFARGVTQEAFKKTIADPNRNKPIPFKKPLKECTKTPNVINEETLKCMQGEE